MNKRGESIVLKEVIFLILNVFFFGIFFFFVVNASSGALVLEQYYAKEIALLLDNSEPGTKIELNISDAYAIARKNNVNLEKMFLIKDNKIVVQLSNSYTYSHTFFNDIDVIISYSENGEVLNLFISENE